MPVPHLAYILETCNEKGGRHNCKIGFTDMILAGFVRL